MMKFISKSYRPKPKPIRQIKVKLKLIEISSIFYGRDRKTMTSTYNIERNFSSKHKDVSEMANEDVSVLKVY